MSRKKAPPRKGRATPAPTASRQAPSAATPRPAVTPERFSRLFRLITLLGDRPRTRPQLLTLLGLDVRGFYRDMELLRQVGVPVTYADGRYTLDGKAADLVERLPFPDPHLSLGEARRLARGRTLLHEQLRESIEALTS